MHGSINLHEDHVGKPNETLEKELEDEEQDFETQSSTAPGLEVNHENIDPEDWVGKFTIYIEQFRYKKETHTAHKHRLRIVSSPPSGILDVSYLTIHTQNLIDAPESVATIDIYPITVWRAHLSGNCEHHDCRMVLPWDSFWDMPHSQSWGLALQRHRLHEIEFEDVESTPGEHGLGNRY